MVNVVLLDQRLQQHAFSMFFIQARNIRLIHIPEKVKPLNSLFKCGVQPLFSLIYRMQFNVTEEVRKFLANMGNRQKRMPKTNERTFKVKRAKARQLETLRDLAAAERQAD